ncbi:MAG: polyprenyl synthetase family protein [Thermomicrobiales bacterium]
MAVSVPLESPPVAKPAPIFDIESLIDGHMRAAVDFLDGPAPMLAGMGRYHLGWVDGALRDVPPGSIDQGKRVRPGVALLCCAAVGGEAAVAAPLGAAIELLHNFTLVHDDIQDHSPTRRHRPTVWTLWGSSQAINAGDALFAAAHLALFRLLACGHDAATVLRVAEAFERMTIDIVAGQVLDLSFEAESSVSTEAYLAMIDGKTAAIVTFAAWAGALLGGSGDARADLFGEFGRALGLGFQIQDDLLGVWGKREETGKEPADDIRRKKKSLPVLMLREKADASDRAVIDGLYRGDEVDAAGVRTMLSLLDAYGVRGDVEARVRFHHDAAIQALTVAAPKPGFARSALLARVESLASRSR